VLRDTARMVHGVPALSSARNDRIRERGAVRSVVIVVVVALVALAVVVLLGLVTLQRHVGYFAPAFSADGKSVVVVERRTRGIAWGLGWEFFTPPAYAHVLSDELRLLRVSLDGRNIEILERWSDTPAAGRTLQQYRGRLFSHLGASVRPRADDTIEYGFEFALPRVPTSEAHQMHGVWSLDSARRRRGEWDRSPRSVVALSEPTIHGEREVFALRGPEAFPAAIAVLDHATRKIDIVIAASVYESLFPNGPALDELMQSSHKAEHDRVLEMTRIRGEREALYRSQGAMPGEATLKAWRDLSDLGYLPKPPRWVARRLTTGELAAQSTAPRIDIDEMEFKVGLMQDIAKAIAQPGAEIDKDGGRYITHRDYPNAGQLNDTLGKGATEVVIGFRGDAYLLRLLPGAEAQRRK